MSDLDTPNLVLAITPFEWPNARLAVAAGRAGALGVLDLGRDRDRALDALAETARRLSAPFGVRVPVGCPLRPSDLPGAVGTVVLAAGAPWQPADLGGSIRALVEVTSPAEAHAARRCGAHGLIAKGREGGGRVGELTTYVLLQRLLADASLALPVWAAGGIGVHTAAAAVAGGAAGVVLDVQLALTTEAVESLPADVVAAIGAMDGSETAVVGDHRVYTRPDLPVARLGATGDPADVARRLGPELRTHLLPVGQEGAFARALARRHRTAGGVLQAVRAAIGDHVRAAIVKRPLAPGSGIARGGHLDFPVVQGPMSRVSDQAAFAAEVARGGGLPFLALALLSGDEVRRLLHETAELLGDRPWGVGLLGFAPPDLREAQLEAVREVRPPYAVIAGGRPAQAVALEAAGIATFLHVPSPGLLDRFLRDGARRFVFEGSECGGHVGPRASFPLWQTQIERLLAFGDDQHARQGAFYEKLEVLFAGGIHDERSAAMVAAMVAPLVERGAAAGVVMGTAYLFTREAVATGAIGPGFQQAALDCEGTALLETSPGHATRCAATPYVEGFARARQRLEAAGASTQEMWTELEQLNLGRLRLASKGVQRMGSQLVEVDADEQYREGLFMIGQVATARSDLTTIDVLHRQVTAGAADFLGARAAELGIGAGDPAGSGLTIDAVRERAQPLEVAVVGMACVLPQAADLPQFWANVVAGVDAVTEVPADRWDVDRYHDAGAVGRDAGSRTPSKWGGFVPAVPFDPLAYGIPPASLSAIEPVQLLALEVAARALADAGYGERPFDRERASVVFGAEGGTDLASAYGFRSLFPAYFGEIPPELDAHLPRLTEDSFAGVLANVIAGRIANRLDLGGVNYTVDAACASSLAALDVACKELRTGGSDLVLCGGADLHNGIHDYLMFASAHALSPTGRCRTFDASADGIALGEGVVCVVLKRLADAERDGDRIYAVVKGVAGSSDGRSLGLTAPRREGQRRAVERAYRMAGVSPAQVGLIEAHGTGTVVGDRTELAALTEVFSEAGAEPGSCALGSVKSQVGHTKCAAGLVGMVKTAYSLYAGVRPPTLQLREPNEFWNPEASPFFFDQQARPWAVPPGERYAGVSAFGFGGTNFHAVLGGYDGAPEPAHGLQEWPAELFCFGGADRESTIQAIDRLAGLLSENDAAGRPWRLRELACTHSMQAPATQAPVRVALVAEDLDDLAGKLVAARELRADPGRGIFVSDEAAPGKVAFLFPGQGSQRPGMLADLFLAFPPLQRLLRGDAAPYAASMFPPAAFSAEQAAAQREALTDTRVAQPAMGIAGSAVWTLLRSLGVRPDLVGGHSYGELVALRAAGVIAGEDLVALSEARAAAILDAAGEEPGTMAAITAPIEGLRAALADASIEGVVVANHNAPDQAVISGATEAVSGALEALEARGLAGRLIPVACAFHSPVVAGAAGALHAALDERELRAPSVAVWSNTTGATYPADVRAIRSLVAQQVAEPVRFVEQVEAMYEAGARVFVEAGPGRVLTGLVGRILGDRPHTVIACDVPGEAGLRRLLLALAELAAAGVPVDTAPLFLGRSNELERGAAPRRPGWTVDGHLVRTADGDLLAGALRPARTFEGSRPGGQLALARLNGHQPAAAQRDATVMEFLRATREVVAAQREVLLGYIGAPALAPLALADPAAPTGSPRAVPAEPPAVGMAGAPAAAGAAAAPTPEALLETLVDIVSARTGYPREMLGPDLDLEADLSIDSIKRTEILGELSDRMSFAGGSPARPQGTDAAGWPSEREGGSLDESILEQLARIKTMGAIVAWITERLPEIVPGASANSTPAAEAPLTRERLLETLVDIVSARTGYPREMLGPDLDLEADLSIDSIKRTEILGELSDRMGFGAAPARPQGTDAAGWPSEREGGPLDESILEQLARIKTMGGIVAWILEHAADLGRTVGETEAGGEVAAPSPEPASSPGRPQRYLVEAASGAAPRPEAVSLAGLRFAVVDDGHGVGASTTEMLRRRGAEAHLLDATADVEATCGAVDGLVHLAALDRNRPPVLPDAFRGLRTAILGGARSLLVATGSGGTFGHGWDGSAATDPTPGIGLYGLVRTIAHEYPGVFVRAVDVDPADEPGHIAEHLLAELSGAAGNPPPVAAPAAGPAGTGWAGNPPPVVVGYTNGSRAEQRLVAEDLAVPYESAPEVVAAAVHRLGLGPDSVVLLTGGARGITAACALALARASGCRIELVGRTPLPEGPEAPALAAAADAPALRAALIGQGVRTPAEVEAAVRRILSAREVRATLDALSPLAASVHYQPVDVGDAAAVRTVVEQIYTRHGRLDGVIHGAGVLEDRLLADKTPESFARVFGTKVEGARSLAAALDGRPEVGFLVLFGSVSGVFGNSGQVDYSAANDALDTLARMWDGRVARRVVALDWGPWGSTAGGMVSPELEREYARRGIVPIAPEEGVAALLAELAWGHPRQSQVVYMTSR